MRLYFLRHADALSGGTTDEVRSLSTQGRRECQILGRFLKKTNIPFNVAYSSPLLRAQQTAELILNICNLSKKVELQTDNVLRNEATPEAFGRWLNNLPDTNHILLVGHAPALAAHVEKLLGIENSEAISLPKCGIICLETSNRRQASLIFFISPTLLGMP